MALTLLFRPPFPVGLSTTQGKDGASREDPAAAARGILLALALSCVVWVALALGFPLLW